jgi:hypothetical protein
MKLCERWDKGGRRRGRPLNLPWRVVLRWGEKMDEVVVMMERKDGGDVDVKGVF